MPDFELNQPDYYTPQLVEENDFINDKQSSADKSKYGLTYSVKFEGDAETFLWTAKTAPEIGKKYYGHLQATSGRSIRFKTDKVDESQPAPKDAIQNFETKDKQDSIQRSVALQQAVAYGLSLTEDEVLKVADKFYAWLSNTPVVPDEVKDVFEDD